MILGIVTILVSLCSTRNSPRDKLQTHNCRVTETSKLDLAVWGFLRSPFPNLPHLNVTSQASSACTVNDVVLTNGNHILVFPLQLKNRPCTKQQGRKKKFQCKTWFSTFSELHFQKRKKRACNQLHSEL